ncbi:MAG: glucose-1-phosphate thymidylyltransferase [Candidatus Omnitrophota bacterium]|jgi:glucose-1-phosphate thymidylyltransferase
MKVVLLAAGYATRLYPLTKNQPKAFLPVGDRLIIDRIVEKLNPIQGLNELIIVTNDKFYESFQDWSKKFESNFKITVLNDGTTSNDNRLGAIGDLQFAVKNASIDDDILVLASDNLFEQSFDAFLNIASKSNVPALIGCYDIGDKSVAAGRYGIVELDEHNKIIDIEEKPQNPKTSIVSMGVYYFAKEILNFIDEYMGSSGREDAPGHYATWLLHKTAVYAHLFTGRWYDIGSLDQLEEASREFEAK